MHREPVEVLLTSPDGTSVKPDVTDNNDGTYTIDIPELHIISDYSGSSS